MVRFDPEHITFASAAQDLLYVADAVDAVRRDPRERDIRRDRALDHLHRKRGLGRKGLVCRNMAPGHARSVVGPPLWQVKRPVDKGMPSGRHIGGEHTDLAIGDLACRTGILTADAARRFALLQEAGLVDHQNSVVGTKRLGDIVAHDIAKGIRIPWGAAQNPLLPPRPRVSCRLRTHPAGLAPLITQQSVQEQTRRCRHTLLQEQPPHSRLHIPQRRCPKLQRRLTRCTTHPRSPCHGDPLIQSYINFATVMLGELCDPKGSRHLQRVLHLMAVLRLTGGPPFFWPEPIAIRDQRP